MNWHGRRFCQSRFAIRIQFVLLKVAEDLFGPINYLCRQSRKPRNLDAVALIGPAFDNLS